MSYFGICFTPLEKVYVGDIPNCWVIQIIGKHFFWTSLHFFWTWTLLLDLTTILLEMATLLLDLRTLLLDLDLALSQTIPLLDRFSSFCPAASASQFSDSRALELHSHATGQEVPCSVVPTA